MCIRDRKPEEPQGGKLGGSDFDRDANRAADDEADDMDRDARFAADAEDDEPITELIHKVDGVTVCEPLEDVLKREMEHLEMKAELSVGI